MKKTILWLLLPLSAYIISIGVWGVYHGVRPTPDGAVYCSWGEAMANGKGSVVKKDIDEDYCGYSSILPPGFPTLISYVSRLGFSGITSALAINVLVGALSIVLLFFMFLDTEIPAYGAAWLLFGYAISWQTALSVLRCWSEPLTVFLVILTLFLLPRRAWYAGVVAGLANTVRYAMSSLVLAGCVYYLCVRKWKEAIYYAVGSAMGFGWLLVINHMVWGGNMPYVLDDSYTIFDCVFATGFCLIRFGSPLLLLLFFVRPKLQFYGAFIFFIVYLLALFYAEVTYHVSPIYFRYMLPIYPAVLLMIVSRWRSGLIQILIVTWPFWMLATSVYRFYSELNL